MSRCPDLSWSPRTHVKPGAAVHAPIIQSLLWGSGRWRPETPRSSQATQLGVHSTEETIQTLPPARWKVRTNSQFTMPRVCMCSCECAHVQIHAHKYTHAQVHTHARTPPPKSNMLGRSKVQEVENEDNKQIFTLVLLCLQELTDHAVSCSQPHSRHPC